MLKFDKKYANELKNKESKVKKRRKRVKNTDEIDDEDLGSLNQSVSSNESMEEDI